MNVFNKKTGIFIIEELSNPLILPTIMGGLHLAKFSSHYKLNSPQQFKIFFEGAVPAICGVSFIFVLTEKAPPITTFSQIIVKKYFTWNFYLWF